MRKIACLLLFIPFAAKAQTVTDSTVTKMQESMYLAGRSLKSAQTTFLTAMGLQITGGIMLGVGSNKGEKGLSIIGGAVGFFGFVLTIAAYDHIGKAGFHLKNNGIAIDLHRRNKQ